MNFNFPTVNVRKSSTAAFVWGAADGGQMGAPYTTPRLEPVRFVTGSVGKVITVVLHLYSTPKTVIKMFECTKLKDSF